MARKYSYAAPVKPEDLAGMLLDPSLADRYGNTPSELFSMYAERAMAADPGLADQLRAQLGGAPAMVRRQARPGSALFRPDAPAAALDGKYAGWGDFLRSAWHGNRSSQERARELQNALSERIPSDGGFAVPEELRSELVLASLEEAICRPLATVVPSSTLRTGLPLAVDQDHSSGTTLGGIEFEWTEEGAALGQSQASYGRLVLEAKKLAAYMGGVPNELVTDAPAMHAFFMQTMPLAHAWAEDSAFISGSGVGEPQGVLHARCAIPAGRETPGSVTFTDVISMLTRMLPQSMTKFVWLASPDVLVQLLQLFLNFGSATSGVAPPPGWLTWNPVTGQVTLLGRPCHVTEHVPALGTAGDLAAVDMSFLVIADRMLMQMDSSADGQGFVKDETEFRFRSRLDARVWLTSAITPQNSSETVSPVVILN